MPKSENKIEPDKKIVVKWYDLKLREVFKKVGSSEEGLKGVQVKARTDKYGANKLPEEKPLGAFSIFVSQFKSAFIYILLIAAGVSFFLEEKTDAIVILTAVIINVVVGFYQEYKAQRALEALQKVVTSQARVRRDGKIKVIQAAELVPGDVVLLQAGDKVPADVRLFEVKSLEVAEATLTGESKPIVKDIKNLSGDLVLGDQTNMAFMSTVVTQGIGKAIVVGTGTDTAIGHIASLVKETEDEETPLQHKLARFSKKIAILVLGISFLIFGVGLLSGHSIGEMFTTAVAVAVSAIPEGLAVTVAVILAVGMRRILKERGLVKKLLAAETLGSTSVICTDKTGTLTQGEMRVSSVVGASKAWNLKDMDQAPATAEYGLSLHIGVLCNNAFFMSPPTSIKDIKINGSPTEKALLLAGWQTGLDKEALDKKYQRLDEVPFDSEKKYMMTLHKLSNNENVVYLKGASEKVLDFCSHIYKSDAENTKRHPIMTRELKAKQKKQYEKMAASGLRVLAVAYKKVPSSTKSIKVAGEDGFEFVGFMGIQDPLRPDTIETLRISEKAHVRTVMITGDHKLTAQAIARDLGLPHESKNILTGAELNKLSASELKKRVPEIYVFARVSPEDKLKIVRAWQQRGEVVAMTGDGVNDAPALKRADIGIAVGSGTDVSKETADLILLDDDFKTIISAIRQGRVIYDNVKKVVLYFLSDAFTEVLLIVTSLLMGWPLPLLAAQILWVNIVDDGFPALALTQDPEEAENMTEKPEKKDRPVLDLERKLLILAISLATAAGTMFVFLYYLNHLDMGVTHARTMAFVLIGVDSLLYIFAVKSMRHPIWKTNLLDNKFLLLAVFSGLALQAAAVYVPFLQRFLDTVPLSLKDWGYIAAISIAVIGVIEVIKSVFFRLKKAPARA